MKPISRMSIPSIPARNVASTGTRLRRNGGAE